VLSQLKTVGHSFSSISQIGAQRHENCSGMVALETEIEFSLLPICVGAAVLDAHSGNCGWPNGHQGDTRESFMTHRQTDRHTQTIWLKYTQMLQRSFSLLLWQSICIYIITWRQRLESHARVPGPPAYAAGLKLASGLVGWQARSSGAPVEWGRVWVALFDCPFALWPSSLCVGMSQTDRGLRSVSGGATEWATIGVRTRPWRARPGGEQEEGSCFNVYVVQLEQILASIMRPRDGQRETIENDENTSELMTRTWNRSQAILYCYLK